MKATHHKPSKRVMGETLQRSNKSVTFSPAYQYVFVKKGVVAPFSVLFAPFQRARSGMEKMIEHFGPEAKRRLFNMEVWDLMQANFMAGAVGLHPIPPDTLQGYIRVLWDVTYQDDEMSPGFWMKKYVEKITRTKPQD